ncbi:hypothetical protein N7460_010062 [Penicillium canescens]|uniref:Uncharacterized protein n=1 Tax=Penicillium canescens TaxID=5083 RepID=A0AAD6I3U6_PENCN|nr:hypothetical protein N7460_010062 [Penicillium canescens]
MLLRLLRSEKLTSTSKPCLLWVSRLTLKICRLLDVADLVGLTACLLPLVAGLVESISRCFLFIRFSLPGAVGLLAFLATEPLLSFSARAEDDDGGGFHDTSESPSGAAVFRLLPMIADIDGAWDDAWDDAWDEAAALLLVRTGSDRGARELGACFD